jgi:hypothetical protein
MAYSVRASIATRQEFIANIFRVVKLQKIKTHPLATIRTCRTSSYLGREGQGWIHQPERLPIATDVTGVTDHDEALSIYKKYDQHGMTINVLVEHVATTDHGLDYSNKVKSHRPRSGADSRKRSWMVSELKNPLVINSISVSCQSLIPLFQTRVSKLKTHPTNFAKVIEISSHAGKHDCLVRFLQMACRSLRELKIDTKLAYPYTKTDRLLDIGKILFKALLTPRRPLPRLASFSAYAAASPPPTSNAIIAVAGVLSAADEALRLYVGAVDKWREELKEFRDMEEDVGTVMRDREILYVPIFIILLSCLDLIRMVVV